MDRMYRLAINAQRNRRMDGQTDDSMMPKADRTACSITNYKKSQSVSTCIRM